MVDIHPGLARALLDQFPAGVAVTDNDNRIVWLNDLFAAMIETSAQDALGESIDKLPLPSFEHAAISLNAASAEHQDLAVKDRLVMISRPFETGQVEGRILMLLDRGHALVSFLNALASGNLSTVNDNGILTNEALRHRLEIEISRSRRYLNPLSCLIIRFEQRTRDGDAETMNVQRATAEMLKHQLRWVDVLGTWDSSSLVVVLPETNEIAANILSTKLEAKVSEGWVMRKEHLPIHWGVSSWRKGDDINRLVRRADNRRTKQLEAG